MLTALFLQALAAPSQDAPPPGLEPADVWELLDPLVPAQMARDSVPGAAVAVVLDGEVVFLEGYGSARLDPPAPVSAETTLFRIGSVSKVCTTLALARVLAARGIAMDAEIAPHLGDLALRSSGPARAPLRFVHLFTHTAGFDQIGRDRQALRVADRLTPRAFLEGRLVQVRDPGEVPCYDTYAITLAGYLLERLSEKPYDRAMREDLFVPLRMDRAFVEAPAELRADLAVGYGLEDGEHHAQPYELYNTAPASSIDATVADMARLMLALLGPVETEEPVFAPETLALLAAPQFRAHPALPGFTLGLWEEWRGAERALWHGGTMMGYSTRLTLFPEHALGIFSACNRDGETGPYPQLHEGLVDALSDRVVRAAPPYALPELAEEVDLARLAGSYADALYCHTCADGEGWPWRPFEVRAVGRNELEFDGRRWRAAGPLEFRTGGGDAAVFRTDGAGRVTHLFAGNFSFERIGESLLEETLGPDWKEEAEHPLVRRVLAHRAGEAPARLAPAVDRALTGELRARWAGTYRSPAGLEVRVEERAAELWLVLPGNPDRRLTWQGGDECRVAGNDALRIVFRGAEAHAEGFTFHDDDGTPYAFERVE